MAHAVDHDAPIPAAWTLAAALVLVHLLSGAWAWSTLDLSPWFAWVGERPDRVRILAGGQFHPFVAAQPWRLVTSVFLHVDALHLLVNVVALLTLGRLAEPIAGPARWLATFCVGGVLASVTSHALGLLQSDGASGGAFALLGALLVWARRHRAELPPDDAHLLGPVLAGVLVANLVLSAVVPALDLAAHLGGALVGAAVGLGWTDRKPGPAWWVVVGATVAIAALGWASLALGARLDPLRG